MARFPNHEGLGFSDRDLGPLCLEWGLGVNCSITIIWGLQGVSGCSITKYFDLYSIGTLIVPFFGPWKEALQQPEKRILVLVIPAPS